MKILTVIPIAKGIPRDELSYFSAKDVVLGTLVTVPFGNRSIKGVVVDTNEVRDLKSSIKTSSFKLRNVTTIHSESQLPNGIFTAGQKTARFFAQPIGSLLQTMIPQAIFDHYITHPVSIPKKITTRPDICALQIPIHERISYYKTLVREHLAKQESVIIVSPTIVHAEKIYNILKTGIEDQMVIAHSKHTKTKLGKTIQRVISDSKPVVLIATAPFASMIRPDWATMIIEQSSSSYYRYEFGPIFDMRFFLEHFGIWNNAKIIFADTLLSSTVRHRIAIREIIDIRSTWHIARPERFRILDMKFKKEKENPQHTGKTSFQILHPKTLSMIKEARTRNVNTILVTTRKGLAPTTSCSDCGTVVTCPICDTPLVLHRTTSKSVGTTSRIYICHHCMHTTEPLDVCASCGGPRLALLGIGTDGIVNELEENFPDIKTYLCDGDIGTTQTNVQKIIANWQKSPGSILIATPIILPYLDTVPFGCIVSMDSLLSLPAYTSGERSLGCALEFLEKISDGAIIQTRTEYNSVITAIENENISDYMQNELVTRTQFNYPPIRVLVKISHQAKIDTVKSVNEYYEQLFKEYNPDILMKKSKVKESIIIQAILKIDPVIWNNNDHPLSSIVRELGKEFIREINPDSVL